MKRYKLDIYNECKYHAGPDVFDNCCTVEYEDCTGFEIVKGSAAKIIENESDGSCIDDYHEYLVIHFADGTTSTFRNSYVDLFAF